MVEGTSLLRKHTGLSLYRGFESLALRHKQKAAHRGGFFVYRRIARTWFKPRCAGPFVRKTATIGAVFGIKGADLCSAPFYQH